MLSARGYAVERLIEEHGDEKMTHLLPTLAGYPKSRSTSIYDGCTMVYEGLTFYGVLRVGWRLDPLLAGYVALESKERPSSANPHYARQVGECGLNG